MFWTDRDATTFAVFSPICRIRPIWLATAVLATEAEPDAMKNNHPVHKAAYVRMGLNLEAKADSGSPATFRVRGVRLATTASTEKNASTKIVVVAWLIARPPKRSAFAIRRE